MVVLNFRVVLFFIVCVALWAAVALPWRAAAIFLVFYLPAVEVLGRIRRRRKRRG